MFDHEIIGRARLAIAKKRYQEKALLVGERRLGWRRRAMEIATLPLRYLMACVQEFLRRIDRRFLSPPSVSVPWDPGRIFLIVGHRGSPAKKIENTFPSFDQALEQDGANAIETDLCVTRDGEVAIWHDWNPDELVPFARQLGAEPGQKYRPWVPARGSPWRRKTSELTLSELRQHFGYARRRGRRAVTAHIPTIEELIEWAVLKPRLRALFLDMKVPPDEVDKVPVIVSRVEAALRAHPPHYEVIALSPHDAVAAAFRAQAPSWSVSRDVELPAGRVEDSARFSALACAERLGNDRASLGRPPLTFQGWKVFRTIVERDLERWGREVSAGGPARNGYVCWTINHRLEQRQLLDIGVHSMLTDHPRQLRRLALARKRPLGPGQDVSPSPDLPPTLRAVPPPPRGPDSPA